MSRRRFLSAAGATAMLGILPKDGFGGPKRLRPSDRLNIAGIGVGGMGGANLRNLEAENIVALCDVDSNYAAGTVKRYPKARIYEDFRIMLEKQKDIDAVVIGTPDHTHAVISMAAIKAGKHVYCQKPLTHDIYEARMLTEAASESKVTTVKGLEPPWPSELEADRRLPDEGGVLFKGAKGSIMCGVYGDSPRLIPEAAMQAYKRPTATLPRVDGTHEQDWARHCKEGKQPGARFEYSGPLTEAALLGNVAKRFPGKLFKWDGPNMRVTNLVEANDWVRRPHRDGWAL